MFERPKGGTLAESGLSLSWLKLVDKAAMVYLFCGNGCNILQGINESLRSIKDSQDLRCELMNQRVGRYLLFCTRYESMRSAIDERSAHKIVTMHLRASNFVPRDISILSFACVPFSPQTGRLIFATKLYNKTRVYAPYGEQIVLGRIPGNGHYFIQVSRERDNRCPLIGFLVALVINDQKNTCNVFP